MATAPPHDARGGDVRISVALVTRNRPESLARTLRSLRAQSVEPWEVVVSDASDAETSAEVEELVRRFGCRYLRGPQRGLYANRNHVALACRGTHVRTMDDDHEFPDGHFAHCAAAVAHDPHAVWIVGEYLPGEEEAPPPPCPAQLHPRGFSVTPPDSQRCWSIADGATIYPRALFEHVRYADHFVFGASYLELGSRLHWLGYRIRQVEGTYVLHHYDPADRSFMDAGIDLASRVFAMLCHSLLYQPTARNRTLTALEIFRQLARHPRRAAPAVVAAVRAYRSHAPRVLAGATR